MEQKPPPDSERSISEVQFVAVFVVKELHVIAASFINSAAELGRVGQPGNPQRKGLYTGALTTVIERLILHRFTYLIIVFFPFI